MYSSSTIIPNHTLMNSVLCSRARTHTHTHTRTPICHCYAPMCTYIRIPHTHTHTPNPRTPTYNHVLRHAPTCACHGRLSTLEITPGPASTARSRSATAHPVYPLYAPPRARMTWRPQVGPRRKDQKDAKPSVSEPQNMSLQAGRPLRHLWGGSL